MGIKFTWLYLAVTLDIFETIGRKDVSCIFKEANCMLSYGYGFCSRWFDSGLIQGLHIISVTGYRRPVAKVIFLILI